jgi:S1-C subfamily serine protease
MADQFVWTCPKCARKVPNGFETCRCGSPRRPEAEPQQPTPDPPQAPPATRPTTTMIAGFNRNVLVLVAVVAGMAATLVVAGIFSHPAEPTKPTPPRSAASTSTVPAAEARLPELPPPPRDELPADDDIVRAPVEHVSMLSTEEIVTRAMPAVVTVETSDGLGSGFFVAPGTVVTNHHVISGNTAVMLRRSGGYMKTAKVETSSPELDLAILKLDIVDPDQIVLPIAAPSDVHIGAEVVAIGSPLGFANSVTRGVVSGLRERNGVRLIQTDAAINPGNSGGPLLDRYGRVLGVNTLKLVVRGIEGMAFAVSIHYARAMLGPGFAPKSDADERREDGVREYTGNVKALAQRADRVETNWKSFHSSCGTDPDAAPGNREWFGLSDGRRPPMQNWQSCRSWYDYFRESAVKTRDLLARYNAAAHAAGVSTDRMRVIRRQYNVDWPEWDEQ